MTSIIYVQDKHKAMLEALFIYSWSDFFCTDVKSAEGWTMQINRTFCLINPPYLTPQYFVAEIFGQNCCKMVLRITCLLSIIVFTDSKYNIGIYFYTTLLLTVVDNGLTFILTECKGQTLIESESVVIKPGNNHKLTCTFSGIDVGDAAMSWIKQAEG